MQRERKDKIVLELRGAIICFYAFPMIKYMYQEIVAWLSLWFLFCSNRPCFIDLVQVVQILGIVGLFPISARKYTNTLHPYFLSLNSHINKYAYKRNSKLKINIISIFIYLFQPSDLESFAWFVAFTEKNTYKLI